MRDELLYAIRGEGAYLGKIPLKKLEPLPIEEAIIGINSSWIIPNQKSEP